MLTMVVMFIKEMMKLSLILEIFQNGLERRKTFNGPTIMPMPLSKAPQKVHIPINTRMNFNPMICPGLF
jgi:hypothetical protein